MHSDALLTFLKSGWHRDVLEQCRLTVTFIRCRLKTWSTFLVKFPPRRGMQILLNSHEHGETLKAFYGMLSLRLHSWSESRSATIFSSVGITRRLFARVIHIRVAF